LNRRLSARWLTTLLLLAGGAQVWAQEVTVHENLAYKSGGSLAAYERERAVLDLYLPATDAGFPLLVWFHGGGLTAGDKTGQGQPDIARALAARGIAVAVANYRLSPVATYPAYIDDAAASVAWALEHTADYGGDRDRVYVSGHSAGGYLAAMVGLVPEYLAAYGHAPSELAGLIPVSGQMITHATVREERGLSAEVPLVDAAAPVHHVRADAPRWLAIAGAEDMPARAEENRYFIAALKAVDHPDASYLEFEGRNHGTIVSQIPEPDDPVAAAIAAFIED
jgi:acetyl esterase/lipase